VVTKMLLDRLKEWRKALLDPRLSANERIGYADRMLDPTLILAIGSLDRQLVREESRIIRSEPERIAEFRRTLLLVLVIGMSSSFLVSIGLSLLFTRQIQRRLKILEEKATLLSVGKKLPKSDKTRDEIGDLGRILDATAAAISASRKKELAALENAADILCLVDANLKFVDLGEGSRRLWSLAPDDLIGRSILSIMVDTSVNQTREVFQTASQDGKEHTVENIVRCGDGTLKRCVWRVVNSAADNQYYCVVHDVTELRATEDLKRMFLSMVSHDIRAPLQSIEFSLTSLLENRRGQLAAPAHSLLEKAHASTSRLSQLASSLLELDRLNAGKLALNIQAVGAQEACKSAIESLEPFAAEAAVRLDSPHGDAALLADEQRLIQVVINLLSNAIKFSPPGSLVSISILDRQDFAEIRITDSGPGIPAEDRATIFHKFRQSQTATMTKTKGTGLGLSIVRAIVEAHGGKVGVESQVGKGSTFWFTVPQLPGDE
jgi:two-component system phosphate regulon sensor histidine kinase PhoR